MLFNFRMMSNKKLKQTRVSLFLDVRDRDIAVGLVSFVRPVLGAFGLAVLLQVGEHQHQLEVLLPDQPPKVADRVLHRSLSADELLALLVADHKVGVDIIGTDHSLHRTQFHPGLVVRLDVGIPIFIHVLPRLGVFRCAIGKAVWKLLEIALRL
jgi:hypothetical protein